MARARHNFEKAQVGKETTWGTLVPATYILPGVQVVRYQPTNAVVRAEKLNGSLAVSDAADVVGKSAAATLSGYACPHNVLYVLEGATHTVTPTGTAPVHTRVYAPTLTAEDVPVARSLEVGSNIVEDQWVIRGALPASLALTGRIGQMAMFEAPYLGRALELHPFTAALTPGPYTRMRAKNAKFFIDPVTGTMGATEVTACVTEFAFASGDLWALVNCIDGTDEASGYAQAPQDPSMVITMQLGPQTAALFADYEAGAQKLVRLQIPGAEISAGPPVVTELIQVDMCANITAWPEIGDTEAENGLVAAVTFSGSEDNTGTFGKLIEYKVVSDLATLV